MISNERNDLTDARMRRAELLDENPFEFFDYRPADHKPVLGENQLQDVETEAAGREGGDQGVGVPQDPHDKVLHC